MALAYDATYLPLATGDIIPGRHLEAAKVLQLLKNHNRLGGTYCPCDLVAQAFANNLNSTTYEPWVTSASIGSTYEYILSYLLPVCLDFASISVVVRLYAEGNNLDVSVGIAGGGTAADQTVTAGSWSTKTFTGITLAASAEQVLYLRTKNKRAAGYLRVRFLRAYYAPLSSPLSAGAMADSGFYPVDTGLSVTGEGLHTELGLILQDGPEKLCSARPMIWSWADLIDKRTTGCALSTTSSSWETVFTWRIRPWAEHLEVLALGYGPGAGYGAQVVGSVDTTGVSTDFDVVGALDYITSWKSLGTINTTPGSVDTIGAQLISDGANYTCLLGLVLYEVWP
jgi:hypothetical protein